MKLNHFLYLAGYGIRTILFKTKNPILATIILTDACNLSCKHCAVNNIKSIHYPYADIRAEMDRYYQEGVRLLFFSGGETLCWQDAGKTVKDLVREAKEIGFFLVIVVSNGTYDLDIPEADLILLSIDGTRETHNLIRGDTFDTILNNLQKAQPHNICIYMAVNALNYTEIKAVANIARDHPFIRTISFNFHTPYPGTEHLALSAPQKAECVAAIRELIHQRYPVFNLESALEAVQYNRFRACPQCTVSEAGQRFMCGRCIIIQGLCQRCGYFFAAEYALIFAGNLAVIWDMLKTYLKYI